MSRTRLVFPSIDGTRQGRIAHGDNCVLLLVEDRDYILQAGLILSVSEAAALGRRLVQQSQAARRIHADTSTPTPEPPVR